MGLSNIVRILFCAAGIALVAIEIYQARRQQSQGIAATVLTILAIAFILFNIYLWINHIRFPLNLDLMEGVVWQHFQRAALFQAIYPEPTPEYVPLAYNPLYYVLAVPFSWVLGVNLFTLRLVAILGMAGSGWILFLVVRQETGSAWWGFMAVGLFAAAYKAMDAYLDTAHSDSWLLFAALWGSFLIYQNRSRMQNLIGVVLLVAAFWFKQHGALFAIGGLLYLTWREGVKGSIIYWLTGILMGPLAYIFAGPWIFGSYFHYFTWTVPRNWSEMHFSTFWRYFEFILVNYLVLALSGGVWVLWLGIKDRNRLNIWHFQFILALMIGFMGSLDPDSSNNIYIPAGIWFIMCGTIALYEGAKRIQALKHIRIDLLALFISITLLLFNPLSMIVSSRAAASYAELISMLKDLNGTVYAPSLGQLENEYKFFPAAHWVALEDMIRGPGRDTRNHPNTRNLLESVIKPNGSAYILTNHPLNAAQPLLGFLRENYVLETDFSDRFEPLKVLPKRWDHGWPRYLYRYEPSETVPEIQVTP